MAAPPKNDVRQVVDTFMACQKTITPFDTWRLNSHSGEQISLASVLVDGEVLARLELNAYPREPQPSYRCLLVFMEWCICRLDNREADGPHHNPFDRPGYLPVGLIGQAHFHSWHDNRRYARYNALPDRLKAAAELPRNVRSFESSVRWFCAECNINIGGVAIPDFPRRDRLV